MHRSDFCLDPDVVFLNHGSFGACTKATVQEQYKWQLKLENEPIAFFYALPERMKQARRTLSELVGACPEDLVYVTNSTYGANIMAYSMARYLHKGDAVLIPDHEYGACLRAWQRHLEGTGIQIQSCHIPMPIPSRAELVREIWKAVTPNTKAIFISHITSPTACLMPIEELAAEAKKAGILMLVDGAHALGQIPLNIPDLGVHMYTANCHKWMCGPKGSALLWVHPNMQQHTLPVVTSWGAGGLSIGDGAFIDEHEYVGTRDVSPFLATPAVIEWVSKEDWWPMIDDAHKLVVNGMQQLSQLPGVEFMTADWKQQHLLMGAVLLPEHIDAPELQRTLLGKYGIQVVCMQWLSKPLLRFSVHGYTTKAEVDVLVKALQTELTP